MNLLISGGLRVNFIDSSTSDNPTRIGKIMSEYLWPVYGLDSKSPCTWYIIVDTNGILYHVRPTAIKSIVGSRF
jgi:hypothetical protein